MKGKVSKALLLVLVLWLAVVGVAYAEEDVTEDRIRVVGEITGVDLVASTFSLHARSGMDLRFFVTCNTRFRSRDGSVTDINDLKKGMIALVSALQTEEGALLAVYVAAWNPANHPGVDVRAGGRIVSLGDRSFTIETRGGDRMTFSVDGSTKYRSRDGSVKGFDDLQMWMIAIIGAKELGSGDLKAVWVGAGEPAAERPTLDSNRLEERPPLREVEPIT